MAASRYARYAVLAVTTAGVATLLLGGAGRRSAAPDAQRIALFASARARDSRVLTEEAIRLYAAGAFPRACEKFGRAEDNAARRQDVARCFEGWGWHALREGRPEAAGLLFRQGLTEAPDDPALLKGLGLSAVHAGRPDDALAPLERAVRAEYDPQVRLLLARLHDRRDDPAPAIVNLRAVLEREPAHAGARRLLEKVEREQRAEAGFRRDITPRFIVKYPERHDPDARRAIIAQFEAAAERVERMLAYVPQQRTTVVLYEHPEFRSVTRAHAWSSGVFDGKIRLLVGPVRPPAHEFARVVVHEYAHAAIHELSRGRAPRWLHEGLAQVLEGAIPDPMLRVPGGLTLSGVEALVGESDPLRARTGYDIALWIVSDLLDRGGLEAVRGLLERLGAGETIPESIPRIYGLRATELEIQWRRVLGS